MAGERADRAGAQPAPGQAAGLHPSSAGKDTRTAALGVAATAPAAGAGPSLPAWSYVEQCRVLVLGALAERIHQVGLVRPHARLRWADPAAACAAVERAIRAYVDAAPGLALKRLTGLAFPADLIGVVDQARNGQPGTRWLAEVGRALGEAFDVPLVTSIQRMGLRLRVQLDHDGAMPRGSALVASCPLDGVIAEVLVAPGVVVPQAAKAAADPAGQPFAHGAQEVEYEWMGHRDPSLWNWIHVTSPKQATAEDVARTPLAGGEVMAGSEQAYRIAASPPYFAIPIETARLVKAATDFAPPAVQAQLARGDLGPRVANGEALAGSAIADEAALAQVGGGGRHAAARANDDVTPAARERALEHANVQCGYLMQRLAPWHAQAALVPVQAFLQRRTGTADARLTWAPVLAEASRTLRATADEVKVLLDKVEQDKLSPTDAAAGPVLEVLRAYAHAAGVAHLSAEAPAALAEARRLRAMLPIALAELRIRAARAAVADQQAAQRRAGRVEDRSGEPIAAVPELATRAADLRLGAARGEGVDAAAADALAADADLTAIRAEIATLQTELATVERLARDVTVENGAGWTIPRVTQLLRGEAASWLSQLDRARDVHRTDGANDRAARTAGARRTLASVRGQKSKLTANVELGAFLQYAYQQIANDELRKALDQMALQIGLMIATGEVAGAAVAAIRGVAMAREARLVGALITDVRKMQLGYQVLETTGQAFLMTRAQGATGGPTGGGAFAENLAGLALSGLAMKPFEALLGDAQGVERELRTWLESAGAGARATVRASLELGTGIAAAGAASTLVHGTAPRATGTDDLVTQGIALVASKLVHRHTLEMRERLTRAMAHVDRAKAQALLARVNALAARSEAAPHLLTEAGQQLAESGEHLAQEAALYQAGSGTSSPGTGDLKSSRAANASARAERTGALLEAPLRLAGLSPVVDGAIFEGTPSQISAALADAQRAGIPLQFTHDPQTGIWHVTSGDYHVELHAVGLAQHEVPATAVRDVDPDENVVAESDKKAPARGRGLPEYPIAKTTIKYEVTEEHGRQLECDYTGQASNGQVVHFGDVHMPIDSEGMPAGPPEASIGMLASVYVGGKEHVPRIYEQVVDVGGVVPQPFGELTPTTRYVLNSFGEFYQRRFGHPLDEWGGTLAFSNKRNFQRAYAELERAGMKEPALGVAAINQISFGAHRAEAGFTNFTVTSGDFRMVDLGGDLGVQFVPNAIEVKARK